MKNILSMIIFICTAALAHAGQTKYVNLQGASAFVKGEFENIQMDAQGRLMLSPEVKEIYDTKNLLIQSTQKSEKGIYFSTAKDAGLFFYNAESEEVTKLYENSQSLSIPSFVVNQDKLYFVESPSNILYSLDLTQEDATPEAIQNLDIANYIWQMAIDKDKLYLSTGAKAGLFSISLTDLTQKPEQIFSAPEERHFITMIIKDGKAYLGSEGAGGLYSVDLQNKSSQLLYKAYEGEISDIIVTEKEGILITTSSKEAKSIGKDFDYTDTILAQQLEYQMLKSQLIDSKQINPDGSLKQDKAQGTAVKNSLYQIKEGQTTKILTLDNISLNKMLLLSNGNIILGTSNGRLFDYNMSSQKLQLISSVDNEDITGLVEVDKDHLLVTTSNIGQVYLVGNKLSVEGKFTSDIIDLGGTASLGRMTIDIDFLEKGSVTTMVRGGQTQNPDNNWTEWQTVGTETNAQELRNLRYIQYQIKLTGNKGETPEFTRILTPYLPNNRVPSITLFSAFYDPNSTGTKQAMQLRWSATDADRDQLIYRIFFKQRQDIVWSLLTTTLVPDKFLLDTQLFPDGIYQFKLEVSDEMDNNPSRVGKTTQVSNFILINNTAPTITIAKTSLEDNKIIISGTIESKTALIAKAYYKIGVEEQWKFILPDNEIYDSKQISFQIIIDKADLKEVENNIFFRAFDVNLNQISTRIKLNKEGKLL